MALPDADRAYIAGFFDGEGSISPRQRFPGKQFSFSISISQVDPRPLIKIKDEYGGILVHRDRSKEGNRRNIWLWQLSSRRGGHKFISDIYPWLVVKKDAADIFMSAMSVMLKKSCGSRYAEAERSIVIDAMQRLKEKNRRGNPCQ